MLAKFEPDRLKTQLTMIETVRGNIYEPHRRKMVNLNTSIEGDAEVIESLKAHEAKLAEEGPTHHVVLGPVMNITSP